MCVVFALVQPSILIQCVSLQVPSSESVTYVGYDDSFTFTGNIAGLNQPFTN